MTFKSVNVYTIVIGANVPQAIADESCTRGHGWKLVEEHSRCDARMHFFSVRVLHRWNSLTEPAVQVNSVNGFKNHFETPRNNQVDFYGQIVR